MKNEEGDTSIPQDICRIWEAQAMQYINATVSTKIGASLIRLKTAYAAFQTLAITYGDQKLSENIWLKRCQRRLTFWPWHDPICFVNEFEAIIADFKAMGTKNEEEPPIAKFLAMIDMNTQGKDNLYVVFYN